MTRKQKRTAMITVMLGGLGIATALVLFGLRNNTVYFYSPNDLAVKHIPAGQRVRIGGLVEKGSLKHDADAKVTFSVTDTLKSLNVNYSGILPDLFREGQGVIAEGVLGPDGKFLADSVLAKHDEKYMPPEVAKSLPPEVIKELKDRGAWRGASTP